MVRFGDASIAANNAGMLGKNICQLSRPGKSLYSTNVSNYIE